MTSSPKRHMTSSLKRHVSPRALSARHAARRWHGTGVGEVAGWSGHWLHRPPAIAHFVGGAPAGGKAELMQGLGWWRYEADVVSYAISEETARKSGLALPRNFFSALKCT